VLCIARPGTSAALPRMPWLMPLGIWSKKGAGTNTIGAFSD